VIGGVAVVIRRYPRRLVMLLTGRSCMNRNERLSENGSVDLGGELYMLYDICTTTAVRYHPNRLPNSSLPASSDSSYTPSHSSMIAHTRSSFGYLCGRELSLVRYIGPFVAAAVV